MVRIATKAAGVAVHACSWCEATAIGADVEGDTNNAIPEGFINPFAILEDETFRFPLVVSVEVLSTTQIAFNEKVLVSKGLMLSRFWKFSITSHVCHTLQSLKGDRIVRNTGTRI